MPDLNTFPAKEYYPWLLIKTSISFRYSPLGVGGLVIMAESLKFAVWASTEKIYPTTSLFSFTTAFYIPG